MAAAWSYQQRARDRRSRLGKGRRATHLRRLRNERRVEDRRQRRVVAARVRKLRLDQHRRHRGRPLESRHRLVGTGEANLFRASMAGVGVYKSTDGGRTFTHAGLTDTQDNRPHRRASGEPRGVDVAASGHEWTDNEMRGVFKTADGGRTWQKVFYRSARTGAIDLVSRIRRIQHALRCHVAACPEEVERSAHGAGLHGRRCLEDDRRRQDVDRGQPGASRRAVSRADWTDVARSNPNVVHAFVDNYEPGRPPREGERMRIPA